MNLKKLNSKLEEIKLKPNSFIRIVFRHSTSSKGFSEFCHISYLLGEGILSPM